jgi:hypothetical protein
VRDELYSHLHQHEPQPWEHIKKLYENMLATAKRNTAHDKANVRQTGGGTAEMTSSSLDHQVIDAVGKSIYPLESPFDSDGQWDGDNTVKVDEGEKEVTLDEVQVVEVTKNSQMKQERKRHIRDQASVSVSTQLQDAMLRKTNAEIEVKKMYKIKKMAYLDWQMAKGTTFIVETQDEQFIRED